MANHNSEHLIEADELSVLTDINPVEVRVAAMDLLARREHSRKELQQKLIRRFAHAAVVDATLDELAQENLQSDTRYAESFVRQRINRGYGPSRIRQEMRQRGISDASVASAMEAESVDWHDQAANVLQRKYGNDRATDIKEKARRSRFMQYRGFTSDHFSSLL